MAKPEFDPRQPFEGFGDKPAFDPNAPFEKSSPSAQEPSVGHTFHEAAANSLTLGYLPQIQAALEPGAKRVYEAVSGKNALEHLLPQQSYVERRDQYAKDIAANAAANPISSGLGTVAGAVLGGAALPGGALARGAGAGKRIIQSAKTGAVLGALANPGDTEGEIDPLQPGGRIIGAGVGAGAGALTTAALEGASGAGQKIAGYFKGKAEEKALKASGAMLKDFRAANRKDKVNELGRMLLDDQVVTPLATPTDIAARTAAGAEATSQSVDDLVSRYGKTLQDPKFIAKLSPDEQATLSKALYRPVKEASALKREFVNKYGEENADKLKGAFKEFKNLAKQGQYADLDEAIGSIESLPKKIALLSKQGLDEDEIQAVIEKQAKKLVREGKPLSLEETMAQKRRLNNFIKEQVYNKLPQDRTMADSAALARQDSLRSGTERMSDVAAELSGEAPGQVKALNQKWGNLLHVKKIADDRVSRDAANRAIGLTDTISGGAGATAGAMIGGGPVGAMIGGALGTGANKLGRTYGASLQATGFDALSKTLKAQSPKLAQLAAKNPGEFNSLVSRLAMNAAWAGGLERSPDHPILQNQLLMKRYQEDPKLLEGVSDPKLRAEIGKRIGRASGTTATGETKWATQGAQKLGLDDQSASRLMADPKARQLLIQASDLKPGSPALKRIMDQLQKRGSR